MHPSGHDATAMPASPPKAGARRAAPLDAPSAMAAPAIASEADFPALYTERKKSPAGEKTLSRQLLQKRTFVI